MLIRKTKGGGNVEGGGVALTSLRPWYHVLRFTVDEDMQSFKLSSLTQNLIWMEKHLKGLVGLFMYAFTVIII